MLLFGYLLPIVVGILMRFYLQSIGEPVIEWSSISPGLLAYFVVMLLYWDLPYFLVTLFAPSGPLVDPYKATIVLGGFLGTSLTATLLFAGIRQDLQMIVFGSEIAPFLILPGTLLGLAIGWIAARIRRPPRKSPNAA